jgi:8-oxo-dGTP diphosphatase
VHEIRAAGGVVVGDDGRIAVVHRPRHTDWSLPKGKLDGDETWEEAALREVEEECGLRCALEEELPPTRYEVGGRPKTVRWWRMTIVEDLGFAPNDEVDELRWAAPDEAAELLSYEPDRVLVAAALRALSSPD